MLPSFSKDDITNPPTVAGVTLSGWPSISVAIESSADSSAGSPNNLFAATNAPTITAAELPNPLVTGIEVWIFIFNSDGVCPIELYKSSTALYTTLFSSLGIWSIIKLLTFFLGSIVLMKKINSVKEYKKQIKKEKIKIHTSNNIIYR